MKKGENAAKNLTNITDKNFSCKDPETYYKRLVDHIKLNLFDDSKTNVNH